MHVLEDPPAVPHNVTAGLLLAARTIAASCDLAMPSVAQILTAMDVSRSRAYEIRDEVLGLLPTLARPPGRPRAARDTQPVPALAELRGEALRFVMSHPGCVHLGAGRARYGDSFRLFVLKLRERHGDIALGEFADAILVPLGTIEGWLRDPTSPDADWHASDEHASDEHDPKLAQIETVLAAWRAWHGDFGPFCDHVRHDHRLDLGNTLIASILFAHGERAPARRNGRSRDEHALRGAFETFFPGAQWVGDGKTLEVSINGELHRVNLELVVDAASDAAVGIAVSAEEDTKAVIDAFDSGVETTGEPPLAMLLDNRPSNHTPEVDAALGDTMRMRSTLGRAQNKAHVEGAFGLFSQKVPPIEIDTREPAALARSLAMIVATTFFCVLNRAPRRDRDGNTRVDLYAQSVTPAQRQAAKISLRDRIRKQQLARQTRAARLDPTVSALLDDAFERLGLLDPERHLRDAFACYPRDEIIDAIAIFDAKRQHCTLPDGVDARYLLGIARNLHHIHEADAITEALIRERLAARDHFLDSLIRERDAITAAAIDVVSTLDSLVHQLVRAERELDRHFWIDAAANLLATCDEAQRCALAQHAARGIHAAFRTGTRERHRLVRILLRRLWPLE